jgi:hypothetical protein
MFGTLLSGKITTDDRLKMFQINEMLMTTFNPLPKNWQWLIFQFIYKIVNLVKSQKNNLLTSVFYGGFVAVPQTNFIVNSNGSY